MGLKQSPKKSGLEAAELTCDSLAKKLQEALLLAKLEDFQREGHGDGRWLQGPAKWDDLAWVILR